MQKAILSLLLCCFYVAVQAQDPVINEFVADHTGTDTNEYVEIFGAPNTDYSAYTIVEIEGDSSSGQGLIDDGIFPVGTTDASGLWDTGFQNNIIENGSVTLLLVENFTGAVGNDIDTNDDGVIDVTFWTRIVDTIATSDGGATDQVYGTTDLAPGFDGNSFQPGGASRTPNGTDTDTVGDWSRNDFDGAGLPGFTGTVDPGEVANTPGELNPDSALPVELVSFQATLNGNAVVLSWKTASETNNAGFEVQRQVSGEYQPLGFVEGFGTTTETQSYQFRVEKLAPGTYAFRLKQIDFAGSVHFSPELEVTVGLGEAYQLSDAYPNPVRSTGRFSLGVQREQRVSVALYNLLGQRVAELFQGMLQANETKTITFQGLSLPGGLYFYRAEGEYFQATRQVVLLE